MSSRLIRRIIAPFLLPASLLYGIAMVIRNKLFDINILKSAEFDFPVISVGNITVGGTGKTPHVEYLMDLLHDKFKVAMLSRGYKRNTKGFLLASKNSGPETIGDEPYQIFHKYKNISVAVDESRVNGVKALKEKKNELQVVILDDAFQHRYILPGVSILLIDYNRPTFKDYLLPAGDLREGRNAVYRADIVIVTKVPTDFKPIDKRIWIKKLNLFPYQYLYFTTYEYGELCPLFSKKERNIELNVLKQSKLSVLLVTGIANSGPLYDTIHSYSNKVEHIKYPDHHYYTTGDINLIKKRYNAIQAKRKIIITTEKDAVKLKKFKDMDRFVRERIFYLPVKVRFLDNKKAEFDKHITNYVKKNKRIGYLHH
ncbi:MAG: tetraacyldisaccharide 4'-kinase [Bacteroidales bacterium]|nr:tetraacyldisaccharide 4'-kinase [Bacteroidales bacterium]